MIWADAEHSLVPSEFLGVGKRSRAHLPRGDDLAPLDAAAPFGLVGPDFAGR